MLTSDKLHALVTAAALCKDELRRSEAMDYVNLSKKPEWGLNGPWMRMFVTETSLKIYKELDISSNIETVWAENGMLEQNQ